MSYLADLVKSFTQTELEQFTKLDVIGKEELLRDVYANMFRIKKFNEKSVVEKHGLSKTHFDKINSVLLAKTIQQIWGTDYSVVFSNLQNKGLISLLFHQLKIYEKKVLKTGNKTQISNFYKSAFYILRAMYHPSYNSKTTHEYGKKYLSSLGNKKRFEDEVHIEMLALYGDMVESLATGTRLEFKAKAERKINYWRRKTTQSKNPVANCFFGIGLSGYYKYYSNEPVKFSEAADLALRSYYAAKGRVEKKWEGFLLSESAYSYLAIDQPARALLLYDEAMAGFPDTIGTHIFHQYVHFASAVISRNYKKAHRIFDEKFKPRIHPGNTYTQMLMEVYNLGLCLALHEKDENEATYWFKQLTSISTKDITAAGRIMIRLYETAYFYFSGDLKTALRLSEKHLDYMKRLPNVAELQNFQLKFIDCINKFTKIQNGNTRLVTHTDKLIAGLETGIYNLQNLLVVNEWQRINALHKRKPGNSSISY